MHPATCAACGQPTHVPFQPTGVRPIYCGPCHDEQRGAY
jgi:CxxC-x17-CxxC domain-containing protein